MLPIHVARRARRQQVRREEVALAGRLQPRAIEQVDVLIDGPAHEHHELIVDRLQRIRPALLQRGVVFDEPLRDGRRLDRRLFDAGAELIREIGPRRERQHDDRHDRRRDEGDEQLAVEARSDLAQQRAAARGRVRRERAEQRDAGEQNQVEHAGQKHQLAEVDQVAERTRSTG